MQKLPAAGQAWGPWFLLALFGGILVWEEVWDLPNTAYLSAWLLLLITAGAMVRRAGCLSLDTHVHRFDAFSPKCMLRHQLSSLMRLRMLRTGCITFAIHRQTQSGLPHRSAPGSSSGGCGAATCAPSAA